VPDADRHERPSLTVDVVVVAPMDGQDKVLLIRRKNPPFAGRWALPGGFVDPHEPLEDAARRELWEETRVRPARLEQLHTFGTPGRDPRGWTVSVAYLALLDEQAARTLDPQAGDDAADVKWFDLLALPLLAFDHEEILTCARRKLALAE